MGDLILISGPNGSGKSRRAEGYIAALPPGERFYIATMRPAIPENLERIAAHRKQREGLGFRTLELGFPREIAEAPVSPASAVLLEDLSNLLANAMFESEPESEPEPEPGPEPGLELELELEPSGGLPEKTGAEEAVFQAALTLRGRCALLVAVTVSGLDPAAYQGETREYILALGRLNRRLEAEASAVFRLYGGENGAGTAK